MSRRPLIGVSCCLRTIDGHPTQTVGDKYLRALVEAAEAVPLLIPALARPEDLADLLDRLDGVMLTGSPSMVDPLHYNAPPAPAGTLQDSARDGTVLPLIRQVLARGMPLLGICRGHQELAVALGSTLEPDLSGLPGRLDHRTRDLPYAQKYAYDSHPVRFTPGGMLHRLSGAEGAMVNSLHWQAIDRPGPDLIVEATAPDGTIEAVRVSGAAGFALSVQWHPEYEARNNPLSLALFRAFGEAARLFGATSGARAA